MMIRSFTRKVLKKYFFTGTLVGIQAKCLDRLKLVLIQLNQAGAFKDMQIPVLALHKLKGEKKTWSDSGSPERWMGHQVAYDLWQVELHTETQHLAPPCPIASLIYINRNYGKDKKTGISLRSI